MKVLEPSKIELTSVSTTLPISAADVGLWLNMSPGAITARTTLFEELIQMAVTSFEKHTWHDVMYKTYDLYFKSYHDLLLLTVAPVKNFADVTNVYYLNESNTWTEIVKGTAISDGIYSTMDIRKSIFYMCLYLKDDFVLSDEQNSYKIKVTVKSGYKISGDAPLDVIPANIKLALKKIVAFHYTNRGDCVSNCSIGGIAIPCDALGLVNQYSIANVTFDDILPEGNRYEL